MIFIGIYLIGYILAYPLLKVIHVDETPGKMWNQRERALLLCVCILSWLGVIIGVIYYLGNKLGDKPAKW